MIKQAAFEDTGCLSSLIWRQCSSAQLISLCTEFQVEMSWWYTTYSLTAPKVSCLILLQFPLFISPCSFEKTFQTFMVALKGEIINVDFYKVLRESIRC